MHCKAGKPSALHNASCPWPTRSPKLTSFFNYYKRTVASYVPELLPGDQPALETHEDLVDILQALKSQSDVSRAELTKSHFSTRIRSVSRGPPLADQNRAFDLAVRVLVMINCVLDSRSLDLLECGVTPLTWGNNESLAEFLTAIFPMTDNSLLSSKDRFGRSPGIKALLTATRLKRIAGLKLGPTGDLRDHLRIDQRTRTLLVFHHVGYLTQNLMASKTSLQPSTVSEAIQT